MKQTEFDKFVGMTHHLDAGIKFYFVFDEMENPIKVVFPYKNGDVVVTPTDENWGSEMFGLVNVTFGEKPKGLQSAAKAFHMTLDHLRAD